MAKVASKYKNGWGGSVDVDGNALSIQGWSSTDSVDTTDLSVNTDNGYSRNEPQLKTVEVTFTLSLARSATKSPVTSGDILPIIFKLDNVAYYDGSFLVKSANIKATVRDGVTVEVSVENQGDVTPVVTP